MGSKNFGWPKNWQTLPNGRRRHISGLEFEYDDVLGWSTCDDTLDEFNRYFVETHKTAVHDLNNKLKRLLAECTKWRGRNNDQ